MSQYFGFFLQGLDILGARGSLGADRAAMQTAPSLATVLASEPEAEGSSASAHQDSR